MTLALFDGGRLDCRRHSGAAVFGEEIFDSATEVNECAGDDRTGALKDQKSRARVDIGVRLAFKGKAKSDKNHQGEREVFQLVCHRIPFWRSFLCETALPGEKTLMTDKSFGWSGA